MTLFVGLFISGSTLTAFLLSLIFGHLNVAIAMVSLLVGVALGVWGARQIPEGETEPVTIWEWPIYLLIGILIYHQFIYLFFSAEGKYLVGNPNNLGDLPFHINMIKAFARGLEFWPDNLEWAGERLRYPFGINIFSALLEILGVRTQAHLSILGILSSFLLLRELRKWAGVFIVCAFFWSGGFDSLHGLLRGSGAWPGSEVDFKNLYLAVFVTQRGFLYALPVGVYLIRQFSLDSFRNAKQGALFALLLGSVPLFHLHSAFFLYLYFCITFFWQKRKFYWSRVLLGSLLLTGPLLLAFLVGGGGQLGNSTGLLRFWTYSAGTTQEFWSYLGVNFLVPIVLATAVAIWAWRQGQWQSNVGLGLLLLFCFVKFAPWAWDNIKLLLWAYLLICAEFYQKILRQRSIWQQGLVLLLFVPGFFQMVGSFPAQGLSPRMANTAYEMECESPHIPINDAIVSAPDFDHPLLFSGAKLVYGYEGHIWSHGYDLAQRKNLVKKLMQGDSDWQMAAKELGAKWIYWGKNEKSFFQRGDTELEPAWTKSLKSQPACASRPLRGDVIYDLTDIPNPTQPNLGH